ncbi:MAG: UDP-N-acetylmuramoyl-L-alanyl-D-glutamate--2,6-diaminopimelate ligase [Janthinobacterium lividum]
MSDSLGDGTVVRRPSLADLEVMLGVTAPGDRGDHVPSPEKPVWGVPVRGVSLDSRRVLPGDLYAALPGANVHGAHFSAQAAAAGAVAVLTDPAGALAAAAAGVPVIVVSDPRAVLGDVAARVHGYPGRQLLTVGITGTNGKTTTAYLVESLLSAAGWRTGLLGTVETRIAGEHVSSVRTTPEAPDLHALLARMVRAEVRGCALEVSSHALALHRVDGLVVDVAVFTNLSQDHLDFHSSMEEYFAAKAQLFTPAHARHGVVAVDGEWGRRLAACATIPVTTVRTDGTVGTGPHETSDWTVTDVRTGRAGSDFRLVGPAVDVVLHCPLPGAFNVSNAALAAVAGFAAGLPTDVVVRGLAQTWGVPGRMQPVTLPGGDGPGGTPLVVVDYAHTPDALERVLSTLRGSTPGRLVAVFGAGGDRDRAKRSVMGAVVSRAADVAVVTDDNPRSENAATVRAAVLEGTRGGSAEILEIADRRSAIAAALGRCTGPQDTVLVAGKGHEVGQEVAGVTTPFDDRVVAVEELRRWAPRQREVLTPTSGISSSVTSTPETSTPGNTTAGGLP